MQTAHEEEMLRIVLRFYAACAAPTRRLRRVLGTICLVSAIALLTIGLLMADPSVNPLAVLGMFAVALAMLALALRLALNDWRDVRENYRRSRRDLFVSTFSEEDFQRQVREKRRAIKAAEAESADE